MYGGEIHGQLPPPTEELRRQYDGQERSDQPIEGPQHPGDYPEATDEAAARAAREQEQEAEDDRLREQAELERRNAVDTVRQSVDHARLTTNELSGSGAYIQMQEILNTPNSEPNQGSQPGGNGEDPSAREQREQRDRDAQAKLAADIARAEAVAQEISAQLQRAEDTIQAAELNIDNGRPQLESSEVGGFSSNVQLQRIDTTRVKSDLARLEAKITDMRARLG